MNLEANAKNIVLRVLRVERPRTSLSGHVVATFHLWDRGTEAHVKEWSREGGDVCSTFESTQEAAEYVGTRIRAANPFPAAQAHYAGQLERAGWHAD